jgi:hypothetical protein
MLGMLLHIDGSKHRWLNDDRWHDLIVILDDVLFVARHDSQIARLEQVMTALAESNPETEATTCYLSPVAGLPQRPAQEPRVQGFW